MSHFIFLGYLVSKLTLLKDNQNIMIPNFKMMEAKDEIFQIFWSGFNSNLHAKLGVFGMKVFQQAKG